MKYTGKFGIEIKMSEFDKLAKCLKSRQSVKKRLKEGLYFAWHGLIDGDCQADWKLIVLYDMFQEGYIELTDYGKGIYGDFKKDPNYQAI